jgi:hypothetical protein
MAPQPIHARHAGEKALAARSDSVMNEVLTGARPDDNVATY